MSFSEGFKRSLSEISVKDPEGLLVKSTICLLVKDPKCLSVKNPRVSK